MVDVDTADLYLKKSMPRKVDLVSIFKGAVFTQVTAGNTPTFALAIEGFIYI